jgi:hypothetical protein
MCNSLKVEHEMRQVAMVTGNAMVMIELVRGRLLYTDHLVFSMSNKLTLLERFLKSRECVFFVRCEMRL